MRSTVKKKGERWGERRERQWEGGKGRRKEGMTEQTKEGRKEQGKEERLKEKKRKMDGRQDTKKIHIHILDINTIFSSLNH